MAYSEEIDRRIAGVVADKPMMGWVMVSEEGFLSDRELTKWLDMAREFVLTLPPKNK